MRVAPFSRPGPAATGALDPSTFHRQPFPIGSLQPNQLPAIGTQVSPLPTNAILHRERPESQFTALFS